MITMPSCRTRVYVRSDNYMPNLQKNFSAYNAKTLCLAEVIHQAPNADRWYFYSDFSFRTFYEAVPDLATLFTDSFKRSFVYIGMKICDPDTSTDMPVMRVFLISLTDMEFHMQVNLAGKGLSFSKTYVVKEPAPENKDEDFLEKRIFTMINKMIVTILSDKDFIQTFFQQS